MINSKLLLNLVLVAATLGSAGCLRPKRANDVAHTYVLSPTAVRRAEVSPAVRGLRLGVGPVQMPAFLLDRRILLRKGTNEVIYLENHRWAERLDQAVQRVLAADLSTLLDSDRIALSSWLRQSVQAEVYVTVQRFDCNTQGQVHVNARWRITVPGDEKTLFTGHSEVTHQAVAGIANLDSAVSELSQAVAAIAGQIADALPGALEERDSK